MLPPGFRVGARRAVSPRAIHVLNPTTFFVDRPVTYSQPVMTRPVKFIGVTGKYTLFAYQMSVEKESEVQARIARKVVTVDK